MSELLDAARRYLEWNDQRWTYQGDLEEWQRLRDAVETAETEQPPDVSERIEGIAVMVAIEIIQELYTPGQQMAGLSKARVQSALRRAAAISIRRWIDQEE